VSPFRSITAPDYEPHQAWPHDCLIQGGRRGIVLVRDGEPYRTSFFEAFPDNTFIRGEGKSLDAAEDAAWSQWERIRTCLGHEYEPRGYHNGAGICRHCGRFASRVFTAEQVGVECAVCGAKHYPCFTHDGQYYCVNHPQTERERERAEDIRRMLAEEEHGRD
jgi:hypothetical protein